MPGYHGMTEARRAASRRDYAKNRARRCAAVRARYRDRLGLGGLTKREAHPADPVYVVKRKAKMAAAYAKKKRARPVTLS